MIDAGHNNADDKSSSTIDTPNVDEFGGGVDDLIKLQSLSNSNTEVDDFDSEYFSDDSVDPEIYLYLENFRKKPHPKYHQLTDEYITLWGELAIRRSAETKLKTIIEKIILTRKAYEVVESQTGIPWYVIAAIHNLESSLNFKTHLHNGDSLDRRTINVPAGRPRNGNPPFTWMESAKDALDYLGFTDVSDWTLPRICYVLEGYNGWGYRLYHSHVKSPYLWSYSNHYTKGKYIKDGRWSEDTVSEQIGAIVLIKAMSLRGLIRVPLISPVTLGELDHSAERIEELADEEEYTVDVHESDEYEEEPSASELPEFDPANDIDLLPNSEPTVDIALREQVRTFWAARNPRSALLYNRKGEPCVDPQLLQASAAGVEAWEAQHPGYRIEMYGPGGGYRSPGGGTKNHTPQPRTGRGAAMDVVIIDLRTKKMLTNHPGSKHQHQGTVGGNAPLYQEYYNEVVRAGSQLFRGFSSKARFGGYFASGANAMDTMHIDMRGLDAHTAGGSLRQGFYPKQMRNWKIKQNKPYREAPE